MTHFGGDIVSQNNLVVTLTKNRKSFPHPVCENIPTWISLSGDLAFCHQDGIYGFKFPKRFWELSQAKTSLYSPLLALFTLLTLIN